MPSKEELNKKISNLNRLIAHQWAQIHTMREAIKDYQHRNWVMTQEVYRLTNPWYRHVWLRIKGMFQ